VLARTIRWSPIRGFALGDDGAVVLTKDLFHARHEHLVELRVAAHLLEEHDVGHALAAREEIEEVLPVTLTRRRITRGRHRQVLDVARVDEDLGGVLVAEGDLVVDHLIVALGVGQAPGRTTQGERAQRREERAGELGDHRSPTSTPRAICMRR
jgi:hypothetical protein